MSLRCLRGKSFIYFFRRLFLSTIICYCRPLITFQNSLDSDQVRPFAAREENVCFKCICLLCLLSYSSLILAGMRSCAVSYLIANSARNESELQRLFLSNHLSIFVLVTFLSTIVCMSAFFSYFIAVSVLARMRIYTVSYAPKMLLSSIFSALISVHNHLLLYFHKTL